MTTVGAAETQSTTATQSTSKKEESNTSKLNGDFEKILKANLADPNAATISEEALFAAIIPERLKKLKGDEAVQKFGEALETAKASLKKADGFIPFEDAAKNALKKLREDGVLTKEETDLVFSEAFAGAQLDDNAEALFDDRGGAGDTTIAVKSMEDALIAAQLMLESFTSDPSTLKTRSVDETTWSKGSSTGSITVLSSTGTVQSGTFNPTGTVVDGEGGFLFKPEAGNGRLAVLSPDAVGALVDTILLKDKEGNEIEKGRFTSYGDDGRNRAKFEFNKPGGQYPDNLTVEIKYKTGEVGIYTIPDPAKRYD